MTPDRDVHHTPQAKPRTDFVAPPRDKDASPASSREINERRARVENSELLRHLRGL